MWGILQDRLTKLASHNVELSGSWAPRHYGDLPAGKGLIPAPDHGRLGGVVVGDQLHLPTSG
ncbi:TPA: hypothetical protein TY417_001575 [Streptococcus suis]|nr:hypothetical protein [Streptococcus suis]